MANDTDHRSDLEAPAILESVWRWWASCVSALRPEQLAATARCDGWTVGDLIAHVTPDPAQLTHVLTAALETAPEVDDASTLLRRFNAPGGLAHSMAADIAAAAVAVAPTLPTDEAARRFEASAALVARTALDPDVVLPYPGVGSLTAAALTDVAIVDATVHGLDLAAAVHGPLPPAPALAHTRHVLVGVPDVSALIDVLTGRAEPSSVLPVMR